MSTRRVTAYDVDGRFHSEQFPAVEYAVATLRYLGVANFDVYAEADGSLVHRERDGHEASTAADPTGQYRRAVCHCGYVGHDYANPAYAQEEAERHVEAPQYLSPR